MTDDLGRLATAIRQRRTELGLSARAIAERAGVSRGTWVGVETARTVPQGRHHIGIERALGWTPGSIGTILSGGDPTPAGQAAAPNPGDLDERLVAEIERIQALPMSADHRLRMIRALVDTYEDARRAREAAQAAAQQGDQQAS